MTATNDQVVKSLTPVSALRMAYLVSRYPAVSHTFILREVLALRERGISVEVASINAAPPFAEMTAVEQSEAQETLYIKQGGASAIVRAILWMMTHRPVGLLRGLRYAIRLGLTDLSHLPLCVFYWAETLILAVWMQRRNLSHLHVHFATQAATVGLILAQIMPVTLSMTVHGPDDFFEVSRFFLVEKMLAARFVVCISFFAQSQLMRLVPGSEWQKFEVARLGVDPDHFAPRPQRSSPDPFELVSVGRLVSAKGQRILIEAVHRLVSKGRRVRLLLVGDGPDRVELENFVARLALTESVLFAGSINQDRIRSFYQAADAFVMASFAEGIPVVLMEAMSMEIPCIATSINGIPELISHGMNGLLVAPSDVEGMAQAIETLMDNDELYAALGRAGRCRVQAAYALGASADCLAEIFRRHLETSA